MLRYLNLIGLLWRISLMNDTAYRADFLMRLFTAAAQLVGELLALWTIFANTRSLAGWSPAEVIVLLGVFRFMNGLIGMLIAPNMRSIMEDIRQGTLDFVLTKPVNSQFYVSFRQLIVWRLADILLGLGLAAVGAVQVAAAVGPVELLLFVLLLAAGATIIYSFWLLLATSVFWFTRIGNIEVLFWNVFEAGRYPVDIYRPWLRWLLTFIVPLALLTTFPAGALIGRNTLASLAVAFVLAPLALAGASWFWRFGLRRYSGASA